jgi:hypothetical protein
MKGGGWGCYVYVGYCVKKDGWDREDRRTGDWLVADRNVDMQIR